MAVWLLQAAAIWIITHLLEQEINKEEDPMSMFRVTVVAAGNHGCQRDEHRLAPIQSVDGCGREYCTDCITRAYVAKLNASGASVVEATIHHWPGQVGEVLDNLVTKKRLGTF